MAPRNPPTDGRPGRDWPERPEDEVIVTDGDPAVVTDDAAAITTGDTAVAATDGTAAVTDDEAATAVTDRSAAVTTDDASTAVTDRTAAVTSDDASVVTTENADVVTTDDSTIVSTDDETIVSQPKRARAPVPPPVVEAPVRPDDPFGRGMMIGVIVLALAALAGAAMWFLARDDDPKTTTVTTTTPAATGSPDVSVPTLTGLDEKAAVSELSSAGLKPRIERRETGGSDGAVVSQAPPASSQIAPGSVVTIVVDAPSGPATPSATTPGATTTPTPTSTPASSTTTPTTPTQSTPTTQTTTPAPPSTVPDVVGSSEQEAVQSLTKAGIVPSIVFVPSQDPLGTVQGQARDAGSQVAADSPVQITISKGPGDKPDETVPDVIGKSLPDALSAINAEQLRLIYVKRTVDSQSDAGKIVKQTPLAGASAPQNGQVLVFLGAYRPGG